jgi:hypothetical protein
MFNEMKLQLVKLETLILMILRQNTTDVAPSEILQLSMKRGCCTATKTTSIQSLDKYQAEKLVA